MLKELLNEKIIEVLSQINSLDDNIDLSLLSEIEKFSSKVLESNDSLNSISKSILSNYVTLVFNDENILNKLMSYKKLIEAKNTASNDTVKNMFSLNEEQEQELKNIFIQMKEFVLKEKEKQKKIDILENEYNKYELILNKIVNKEIINEEEYEIIIDLVKDKDIKDKCEILKEYLTFLDSIEKKLSNEKKLSDEEIDNIYDKYLNILKNSINEDKYDQFKNISLDYKKEIAYNFDENRINEVINTLKENNILSKFEIEVLMSITLYSDRESIEKTIDFLKYEGMYSKNVSYTQSGLWISEDIFANKGKTQHSHKRRINKNGRSGYRSHKSLLVDAKKLTKKEFKERMRMLEALGYSRDDIIAKSNSYFSNSSDSILSVIKVCEKYYLNILKDDEDGKVKGKPTVFKAGGFAAERCDEGIECHLLEADSSSIGKRYSTYINNNPTFISKANKVTLGYLLILQTLAEGSITLPNGDELTIEKCFYRKGLSNDFKNYFGLDLDNVIKLKQFMESFDMTILDEGDLPRYYEMQKEIIPNLVEFSDETLSSEFIKELDDKYQKNDYSYDYNGKIISRYKVLRIYESLKAFNYNNPDESFTEQDIRFFALSYNMFMKKDAFNILKNEIYSEGKER